MASKKKRYVNGSGKAFTEALGNLVGEAVSVAIADMKDDIEILVDNSDSIEKTLKGLTQAAGTDRKNNQDQFWALHAAIGKLSKEIKARK